MDLNLCCPQEFYLQMNVLFFLLSSQGKAGAEKVNSFMEEFPIVRRSLPLSAIGPKGYNKVWFSENKANDVEVKHFVPKKYAHAPNLHFFVFLWFSYQISICCNPIFKKLILWN